MAFGDAPQGEKKISPIDVYLDWKNDKKRIEKKKEYEKELANEKIDPEDKKLYEKKLKEIDSEPLYGFKTWDKVAEQEVKMFPSEFILLDEISCLKGWDSTNNCMIVSNEVHNTLKENIKARSLKGGTVYDAPYNREECRAKDLKYHKGLIVQEGDMINEYYISGSAINSWIEQIKEINTQEYKVKYDGVDSYESGGLTYNNPKRTQGAKITPEEVTMAMNSMELIREYFNN